jgi:hypothetical protein
MAINARQHFAWAGCRAISRGALPGPVVSAAGISSAACQFTFLTNAMRRYPDKTILTFQFTRNADM